MPDTKSDSSIPLARAIQDLRAELLTAVAEGKGKDLRFKLKPVELELSIDIKWSAGAEPKLNFYIFELSGLKGGAEQASAHKLKLTLEPVNAVGNAFFVSDDANPA